MVFAASADKYAKKTGISPCRCYTWHSIFYGRACALAAGLVAYALLAAAVMAVPLDRAVPAGRSPVVHRFDTFERSMDLWMLRSRSWRSCSWFGFLCAEAKWSGGFLNLLFVQDGWVCVFAI